MVHSCIYLGWDDNKNNYKICHALASKGGVVEIANWNEFLEIIQNTLPNKLIRYHPVVAFKKPELIIEHIAKSILGRNIYFGPEVKGKFHIYKNNCENFANVCVLGINFSELIERKNREKSQIEKKKGIYYTYSSKEESSFSLVFEVRVLIEETNDKFNKDNFNKIGVNDSNNLRNKIKDYGSKANKKRVEKDVMRDGIEMQCYIEVQPKSGFGFGSDISSLFGRMNI